MNNNNVAAGNMVEMNSAEIDEVSGGMIALWAAVGAACYEAGEAIGKAIYYVTH